MTKPSKKEDAELIASIFDPANAKVCSDCPIAKPGSTVENCGDTFVSKEAGCCSWCAKATGYLNGGDSTSQQRYRYKKRYGFDKKYGFFNNAAKECGLPRKLRSETCLSYACSALSAVISLEDYTMVAQAIKRLMR